MLLNKENPRIGTFFLVLKWGKMTFFKKKQSFFEKSCKKIWLVSEICITFASAFALKPRVDDESMKKEFFENIFHTDK